jgi:hypothetical protein
MVNSDRIRYTGFQPANDGGRRFEFVVKTPDRETSTVAMEIPGALFSGPDRVLVQEGAGICFAMLRRLLETMSPQPLPSEIRLTEADVREYRPAAAPDEDRPWGMEGSRSATAGE